MHEHKECEHELKFCSKCNVVYCELCNSEWRKPVTYSTWYNNQTIGDGVVNIPANQLVVDNINSVKHLHEA